LCMCTLYHHSQNDRGSEFYLIASGSLSVSVSVAATYLIVLSVLAPTLSV